MKYIVKPIHGDVIQLDPWASSETQGRSSKLLMYLTFFASMYQIHTVTTPVLEDISNLVVRVTKHVYLALNYFCAEGSHYASSCLKGLVISHL